MMLSKEDTEEIKKIEDVVCDFYNVMPSGVYDKNHRKDTSAARAFIYYMLHVDRGLSVGCISKKYGRTPNAIFKSLSKTQYLVKNCKTCHDTYNDICSLL